MLQAITNGKSKIYRRYLGQRDSYDSRRVTEEDELTSLLLGPLEFFPGYLSGLFWGSLLSEMKAYKLPEGVPINATMNFWPSRKIDSNDSKQKRIEPDLFVDLQWPSGQKCSLLIEMKWRAPLSGEDQLHRQWTKYLSNKERDNSYHLFIAPETSEAIKAVGRENVWNGRLIAISWFDILSFFHDKVKSHGSQFSELIPWMNHIIYLMDKLGIRPFKGFNNINHADIIKDLCENRCLFWRVYNGFFSLNSRIPDIHSYPLFFNNFAGE